MKSSKVKSLGVLVATALLVTAFAGCSSQEEPWVYKNSYLEDERYRSSEDLAALRSRLNSQGQR